ncbi:MAG: Pyruvate kinase, alpha/beta domain [Candidatus Bathyarchaeota archaeon BA1]|nr:MAG: Pyruvate kinase, alpha/beta domain [Candidatus Bathyarchaeota archaeon BA1]
MSHIQRTIVYFDRPGPQNTEEVLRLTKERAGELDIKNVVVASTRGETGVRASEVFRDFNVVVVSHSTGFKGPGVQEMTDENRKKIQESGGKILTCTEAFIGVERAIRNRFGTAYPTEIMAQTLRLFGEGTKVAVEITVMAADAGLIPIDKDVIAIAGTSRGSDTALVIQPANSMRIFDLIIKEIIAKPRTR